MRATEPTRPLRLDPERALLSGLDWEDVFGSPGPVEVEIGIGKGRFLLAVAEARPGVRLLGVEWANEYLRVAEARAEKRGLENVRFVRADARELVARSIPDASVDAYYVFYPDPWPKKRHHKRRLITLNNVAATWVNVQGTNIAKLRAEHARRGGGPGVGRVAQGVGRSFRLKTASVLTSSRPSTRILSPPTSNVRMRPSSRRSTSSRTTFSPTRTNVSFSGV